MSRHCRCNCHWADRLIPVRSTDLFENPRFITQNSPAQISRLATAAGEATAHPIRTRMPRMDTNKSVREIDAHLETFLRDAFVGNGNRYPDRAGFARACGRGDHSDLHARDAKAGIGCTEPAGWVRGQTLKR